MGKNPNKTRYETVIMQLLVVAAAVLTPLLAFNFMELELFSVSKTMFITLWSSINPWLYPPYVYLLINFIILIIFASSFIHSTTIFFNPSPNKQSLTNDDSFIESSFLSQNIAVGGSLLDDNLEFHTMEDTNKKPDDELKLHKLEDVLFKDHHENLKLHELEDTFKDRNDDVRRLMKDVGSESVVDKRELRKSRTFHEGRSMSSRVRRERYVRILSQDELDRRVQAFIYKFKKDVNV